MRLIISAKRMKHHGKGLRSLLHKADKSIKHLTRAMDQMTTEEPKKVGMGVKHIKPIKFKF